MYKVSLGRVVSFWYLSSLCAERDKEVEMPKCQRTMINKGWPCHRKWKCDHNATHKQDDGLPLCEKHYNKWRKKNAKD